MKEFGNAVEVPAHDVEMALVENLLAFNYKETKRYAFPSFLGTYEIKSSGVQGRPYIYRLDGNSVEEDVKTAFYGLDENDEWVGRAEDWTLPEGHATGLRYYQQIGWYAQVPDECVVSPRVQKIRKRGDRSIIFLIFHSPRLIKFHWGHDNLERMLD